MITKGEVISLVHKGFILYMLVGWISGDIYANLFYMMCIVSMKAHWYMNDDTCALTIMEQMVTGVKKEESFINQIVNPIYKISDKDTRRITRIVTDILFLVIIIKIIGHKDLGRFIELIKRGDIVSIIENRLN